MQFLPLWWKASDPCLHPWNGLTADPVGCAEACCEITMLCTANAPTSTPTVTTTAMIADIVFWLLMLLISYRINPKNATREFWDFYQISWLSNAITYFKRNLYQIYDITKIF
jgi:hypothetical protein